MTDREWEERNIKNRIAKLEAFIEYVEKEKLTTHFVSSLKELNELLDGLYAELDNERKALNDFKKKNQQSRR